MNSTRLAAETSNSESAVKFGIIASLKRGFEQFIYREVEHLIQFGADVTVFPTKHGLGLYNPKPEWKVVRWSMISVLLAQLVAICVSPIRYVRILIESVRFRAVQDFMMAVHFSTEMKKVDVLYATFGDRKLFIGYFGKRLTGKPLICTVHAYELYLNPNKELFRHSLHACDRVLTISEFNRQKLMTEWGLPSDQVEIVTYSIDAQVYSPKPDRFVILIVGFFVQRKGHKVLFEAIKKLNDKSIEVWVVGDEGVESTGVDVRQQARETGVDSQVAFFSKQSGNALLALYRSCDLFCLPCHFDHQGVGEGFPNVIVEAMACGKPVISTRHVGIPEFLNEIVIEENDPDQLASAIESIRKSPERLRSLGQANRTSVLRVFSPNNVEKTIRIAKVLSKK